MSGRKLVRRAARKVISAVYPSFFMDRTVLAEQAARHGKLARELQLVHPAERVQFASAETDPFMRVAKHYVDGYFDRPNVFACQVPGAYVHVPSGMVCTRDFRVLVDEGLDHRKHDFPLYYKTRPFGARRVKEACSSINHSYAGNFWHWMVDCLPRIQVLAQAMEGAPLLIFMPATLNDFQRTTLETVVPSNFRVEYLSDEEWIQADSFIWASPVSQLCMGYLPQSYYESIRQPLFDRLGLPTEHDLRERIYVSRAGAKHRKVLNEEEFTAFLENYGFRRVLLEELSFEEQVRLFHRAAIVIGPHGAGLGTMFFSGNAELVALYANRLPPNYFHSLACGLGQRHHFVCHDGANEDDSFVADLPAIRRVLEDDLKLTPSLPLRAAGS